VSGTFQVVLIGSLLVDVVSDSIGLLLILCEKELETYRRRFAVDALSPPLPSFDDMAKFSAYRQKLAFRRLRGKNDGPYTGVRVVERPWYVLLRQLVEAAGIAKGSLLLLILFNRHDFITVADFVAITFLVDDNGANERTTKAATTDVICQRNRTEATKVLLLMATIDFLLVTQV
jgi:hypothetical protein